MWRKTPLDKAGQKMTDADAPFDFSVEVYAKAVQSFSDKLSDPEDSNLVATPPYEVMKVNRTFVYMVKPYHHEKDARTEVVGYQVDSVASFWTPFFQYGCTLREQFKMTKDQEYPPRWWALPWRTEREKKAKAVVEQGGDINYALSEKLSSWGKKDDDGDNGEKPTKKAKTSRTKEQGIQKAYREAPSKGQPNMKVRVFERLQLPPNNMVFYPHMPWVLRVTEDHRAGGSTKFRTVDAAVPFPLSPLPGLEPNHPIVFSTICLMVECMKYFEEKHWP